jgi:hypothetical protein
VRTWQVAFAGLCLCGAAATAAAQAAAPARDSRAALSPAGTATVRGRVVAAGSGDLVPIRDARVSISAITGPIEPVFTDSGGRFEFSGLPAGRYTLTAEKTGFVRTRYGSKNDLDPPSLVDVSDGAAVNSIEIRLPKGAAILGRIVDELGDPVIGAAVSVGYQVTIGSDMRLVGVSRPGSETDDRGEYRVGGLAAGRYYVSVAGTSEGSPVPGAPPESVRTTAWSRTFYFAAPGLSTATPIMLGAGEERPGIDLVLTSARSATLTLSLADATGAPATGLINLFLPGDAPGSILTNRGVPLSPGNPKMTPTLEPGEWVAVALSSARALAHVRVSSGEEASLQMTLGPGARIAGRVVFEGSSAPPTLTSVRLGVRGAGADTAIPAPGLSNGPAAVNADGTFEITGVIGTIELQPASPLRGWTLRSVRYGDRDLLDDPLTLSGGEDVSGVQVVFTDQIAELSGTTLDAQGRPFPGCAAAMFPADDRVRSATRRMRLVRTDQNGRFSVADLPSGSYLVAATPDVDAAIWRTLDSLGRLQTIAVPVTLTGREKQTLSLVCVSLP